MIEQEVIKCLERHGFHRNISHTSSMWGIYESAKQWVIVEVAVNGEHEYDEIILAITNYLNI
jgi:hypothetical protein